MGYYRFFLAFCVLYAHAFGSVAGWNVGVLAVISFFVMSGYVMALLVTKYYPSLRDIPAFYLDRAARIYPQYLFYMALTVALVAPLDLQHVYLQYFDNHHILMNALLLPLGYYMFGIVQSQYVPQAWSLGLELTFYLLFPFFWLLPKSGKFAVMGLSVAVFILAVAGVIYSNWYAYRLLPGTFFLFAAGSALAFPDRMGRQTVNCLLLLLGMTAVAVAVSPALYASPYNKEVVTGALVGIVAIRYLRLRLFSTSDELMGNLSYGVFLNHFLLIFITERWQLNGAVVIPLGSMVLAVFSYYCVERPALIWRRRLRNNQKLLPLSSTQP